MSILNHVKNKLNLEIGVSSRLLTDYDLVKGISVLSKYGIKNMEISSSPVFDGRDKELLSKLEKGIRGKVNIVQTHPGGDKYDLSVDEPRGRKRPLEHLKEWVKDFVGYDRPILVVHPSEVFPLTEERQSRLAICKRNLVELVSFCEEHDTKVAVETMWNISAQTGKVSILGETEEEFLEIVNCTESKHFGIHIDTGHSHLLGNLMRMVELAEDRLFSLHVHDNHGRKEGPAWDEHLIPGKGDIDWQDFTQMLSRVNYRGTFLLELPPKGDLEERLRGILT